MTYPQHQSRRLRRTPQLRTMMAETTLSASHLVLPLFVCEGANVRKPVAAIPGTSLLAGRALAREAIAARDAGIPAVLLFAVVPETRKDPQASFALDPANPVCTAIRTLKRAVPDLAIVADLCLCEYTSHRHCGILKNGHIDNEDTLQVLAPAAVRLAEAGADIIAPAGVMDGVVATLRRALDLAGASHVSLMPYSAKFASRFYGPFKVATRSAPSESLHATHQLNVANTREALRQIRTDVAEGADIVIVKPAMTSLDIIALARRETDVPLAGYDVSGSYKMMMDCTAHDQQSREAMMMEALTCINRAGADLIITYYAREAARILGR